MVPLNTSVSVNTPLSTIASIIRKDWNRIPNKALTYVMQMQEIRTINDITDYDIGSSIVLYFLANANSWNTPTSKRIKEVLSEMCKDIIPKNCTNDILFDVNNITYVDFTDIESE